MTLNTENRDPGKGHGVGLLPCGEGRGYIIKIIIIMAHQVKSLEAVGWVMISILIKCLL